MLTARTKTGKNICLGYDYKKETLLHLRNKEEFLCPVCGEAVYLKLGDTRIYHFAHKSGRICRDFYENESITHMEGKRQLFQWLKQQRIPSELEYYDKEIQQRPDIMFVYNRVKYALEFQCSSIPEKVFRKRTNTYLQNGYHPLWILGSNHPQQKKKDTVSLSNFHFFFLRKTTDGSYYIPTYSPEDRHFHILGSIISYTVKNAFSEITLLPINKIPLDELLTPKLLNQINVDRWKLDLDHFLLHYTLHPSPQQFSFLHELYNQNLNPYLLPPEIGLPVRHSFLLQTSPFIWQAYLYIDLLSKRCPEDRISFQEIEQSFNRRVGRGNIIIRNFPQLSREKPFDAVMDYLFKLEKLGILARKEKTSFNLQKNIMIPSSNRERDEYTKTFFQKNHHILVKV